jgi:hypothetical protein
VDSLIRFGNDRLTRFVFPHSRRTWREHHATMLLTAAQESLQRWGSGAQDRIDFAELAAGIAVEAEQAQMLTQQIAHLYPERVLRCDCLTARTRRMNALRFVRLSVILLPNAFRL